MGLIQGNEDKQEEVSLDTLLVEEEYRTLPKELRYYSRNNSKVEQDIYVRGAAERWLRVEEPYRNIFNIVDELYQTLIRLRYKVAFGYFKVSENIYKRGCFLVRDGNVVDINRQFYKKLTEMDYIMYVELDIQDYIKAVVQTEGDIYLGKYFKRQEGIWLEYAREKRYKIIK